MEFQLNNLMAHISTWFTDVKLGSNQLLGEEQILIGNYAANRASDFATGRYCARRALLRLGLPQIPVLIGENNQPCWPAGYSGSISHADGLTGAIIASKTYYRSLGIDLEVIGRVRPDLWHILFTEEELNWLEGLSATEAALESTILLSTRCNTRSPAPSWTFLKSPSTNTQIDTSYRVRSTIKRNWKNSNLFMQ